MERRADLTPKFFEVILSSTTGHKKLRLHNDLVQRCENQFGNLVRLIDCAGGVWHVELEKVEDAFWLHNGWDKFYHDHSIDYGYLILFKYKGASTFKLNIFDLNATEVHYPPYNNHNRLENSTPNRGLGDNDLDTCHNSISTEPAARPLRSIAPNGRAVRASRDKKRSYSSGMKKDLGKNVIHTEGTIVLAYPSFTVTMKANLDPKYIVYVPARFARGYLRNFSGDLIEIHDSYGTKWPIRVNFRDGLLRYFCWANFSEAKRINNGDTCVFELICSDNPVVFKVSKLCKTSGALVPI